MNKLNILIIALLAMIQIVGIVVAEDSTYLYYSTGNIDVWNIDQTMWLEQKSPTTFWAMYWTWKGSNYGGYMGIQTGSTLTTKYNGETAIFSLWNANGASGESCKEFDGEGIGYHCYIPMKVTPNALYKYRVSKLNTSPEGQWWGAWINDEYIGSIRVKSENAYMENIIGFSEYYGADIPCDKIPKSISNWMLPTLNDNKDTALYTGTGKNKCDNDVVKNQNTLIRLEKGRMENEVINPVITMIVPTPSPAVAQIVPTPSPTVTQIVSTPYPVITKTIPLSTPCKKWDGVEWIDCQSSASFDAGQEVTSVTGQFVHGVFNQLIRGLNGWVTGS